MENRINVAELLKDCPKGMELNCTAYENVSFDKISSDKKATYPILCYITDKEGNRSSISFTENGCESKRYGAKCAIFPKGKNTWEGFVPPCKFKDGDILSNGICICIYNGNENDEHYGCYVGVGHIDFPNYFINRPQNSYFTKGNSRLATEEEKQKLFEAIKANGYKWNAETKTLEKLIVPKFKVGDRIIKNEGTYILNVVLISPEYYTLQGFGRVFEIPIKEQDSFKFVPNKFDIKALKPFDKVLVRCGNNGSWSHQFFAKYRPNSKFPFVCTYNSWSQCIPYEGNEHLLGTTEDCEDRYKMWLS